MNNFQKNKIVKIQLIKLKRLSEHLNLQIDSNLFGEHKLNKATYQQQTKKMSCPVRSINVTKNKSNDKQ